MNINIYIFSEIKKHNLYLKESVNLMGLLLLPSLFVCMNECINVFIVDTDDFKIGEV
jgi:hypothetical protein